MSEFLRAKMIVASCIAAAALAACGGGGGGTSTVTPVADTPTQPATTPGPLTPPDNPTLAGAPGAPLATGNIALDGREWINYRRSLVGMSTLTHSNVIDIAAQGHSDYQRINNTITHDQTPGKEGFTGVDVAARLAAAGYVFNTRASRAYGEVISAAGNSSGQYMAEELITAVYHRFVIFEPVFKDIGTGSATTAQGYNYFTANFAANNGYGAGLPSGQVAVWPFNGQTAVTPVFFNYTETPNPVPPCKENPAPGCDLREVGYPVSVHANIDVTITVTSFTIRPRGGAELAVRLLSHANDTHTGSSSAAIVPLARLAPNTTYDVSFTGSAGAAPVSRTWSFTTR